MGNKYFNRLLNSYRVIKFELSSFFCSVAGTVKVKIFFNREQENKLEIGVGYSAKKKGFITSDVNLRTDYPYDLRSGLPFPADSLNFIYAEHVFEHFDYRDLMVLLEDCYKSLKPEGILSVAVPDAELYLKAYFNPENFDFKKYCLYDFGLSYRFTIDYVNYIFYMGGHHRYMFDRKSLPIILKEIGFKEVYLRNFAPELDQESRRYESFYVKAVK